MVGWEDGRLEDGRFGRFGLGRMEGLGAWQDGSIEDWEAWRIGKMEDGRDEGMGGLEGRGGWRMGV